MHLIILSNLSDGAQFLLYILYWKNGFKLSGAFAIRHKRVLLALLALHTNDILKKCYQMNKNNTQGSGYLSLRHKNKPSDTFEEQAVHGIEVQGMATIYAPEQDAT
jgi:hypothetical protein